MTYCLAWKKNNTAYLISDTAASCIYEVSNKKNNSFGEIQGLYGNHYVSEEQLKIYQISPSCAVAFSGNIEQALEVIETLYTIYDTVSTETLLEIISLNYLTYDIELIILLSNGETDNNIFLFKNGKFEETDWAEIGNTDEVTLLSKDAHGMVNSINLQNVSSHYYLAFMASSFQCYFLKNSTFTKGVGGVITGIYLNNSIKVCRNLEYYIFEEDIHEGISISIISKNDSFFSSSSYHNGVGGIRYFLNRFKDGDTYNDPYNRKAISKSVNTKNAYYYVFYNRKYNTVAFLDVNGKTHNTHFRRYIKREENSTYYVYAFNPDFTDYFKIYDSSSQRIPTIMDIPIRELDYLSHDELISFCNNNDLIKHQKYQTMDFDFSVIHFNNYDPNKISDVKNVISNYRNLVIIDFKYFAELLDEIIKRYQTYHNFNLEQMNLEALIDSFTNQILSDSFEHFCFVIVKQQHYSKVIKSYDIADFFKKYPNVYFIESDNYMHDFNGTTFELMKQYYINDNFFHLDKFIIMADNPHSMELLYNITPEFNFSNKNPDIFLIRNLNSLTHMDGRLRYIVSDYLLYSILGLSIPELNALDTIVYDFD